MLFVCPIISAHYVIRDDYAIISESCCNYLGGVSYAVCGAVFTPVTGSLYLGLQVCSLTNPAILPGTGACELTWSYNHTHTHRSILSAIYVIPDGDGSYCGGEEYLCIYYYYWFFLCFFLHFFYLFFSGRSAQK